MKDKCKTLLKNKKKYSNQIKENEKKQKRFLKDNKNKHYNAYSENVNYNICGNLVKDLFDNESSEQGFLINSNNLGNKQNHYLIFEEDLDSSKLLLERNTINNFKTNVTVNKKFKGKLKELDFKKMKEGELYPVFYCLEKVSREIISFGYTPYLKIPYKKSIKECLNMKEVSGKIDYSKALFGFANSDDSSISFKSRLSFTNAKIISKNQESDYKIILSSPKTKSFQLYIDQDLDSYTNDKCKTYNSEKSNLRGQKFYWLKETIDKTNDDDEKRVVSTINTLDIGAKFSGRIFYNNLSDDELGLLLLALKPSETSCDNIGQGKPYGFGRISVKNIELIIRDLKKSYQSIDDKSDIKTYIEVELYKKKFVHKMAKEDKNYYKVKERFVLTKELDKINSVRDKNKFEYMEFEKETKQNGRYRDRYPLETVDKILKLKSIVKSNVNEKVAQKTRVINNNKYEGGLKGTAKQQLELRWQRITEKRREK